MYKPIIVASTHPPTHIGGGVKYVYIAHTGLELRDHLLLSPKCCWNQRLVPPQPTILICYFRNKTSFKMKSVC